MSELYDTAGEVDEFQAAEAKVSSWVKDWTDQFDQSWGEDDLLALLWKKIKITKPIAEEDQEPGTGTEKVFEFIIVGYSVDFVKDRSGTCTRRASLITSTGAGIQITNEMTVEVL